MLLVRQLQHGFTKNAKVSPNLTVAHIAPVGVRTHDLPHTVASNMGKSVLRPNHSATAAVETLQILQSNKKGRI